MKNGECSPDASGFSTLLVSNRSVKVTLPEDSQYVFWRKLRIGQTTLGSNAKLLQHKVELPQILYSMTSDEVQALRRTLAIRRTRRAPAQLTHVLPGSPCYILGNN